MANKIRVRELNKHLTQQRIMTKCCLSRSPTIKSTWNFACVSRLSNKVETLCSSLCSMAMVGFKIKIKDLKNDNV
jgi:hypothetical protein